jgi:recombination protein RecA
VLDAHRAGEPAAWIRLPGSSFYPPDVADSGVDLDALIVVRAPDTRRAARAAERLVRSGAFGLVILDLTCTGPGHRRAADSIPIGLQGRLIALAQRHDAAVVCVTAKSARDPSIGSMVSLRAEVRRERAEPGYFRCALRVLKDKRRGPGWTDAEVVRGPTGVR